MDLRNFFQRYGMPAITVQLRWDKLTNNTEIEEVHLNILDELSALRTAWYAPQDNESTDFESAEKDNLTVGSVAADLDLVPNHKGRIEQWIQVVRCEKPSLVFPAYGLPNAEYLLLDGNHRAVAAAICEALPVTLHVLKGEVSREVLPDLWRWEQ